MSINKRIRELMEQFSYGNQRAFAKSIGVNQSTIGTIIKSDDGNKGVNSATLEKIIIAYPIVSEAWLLTGSGGMLKNKDFSSNNNILGDGNFNLQGNIGGNSTINNLNAEKIIYPDGTIEGDNNNTGDKCINKESESVLKNEIIRLQERIHDMERTIQSQEKTILSLEKTVNLLEKNDM